jgi:hypothetical protein
MPEQRRGLPPRQGDRRIDTRVPVDLWVKQEHEGEFSFSHTADLSPGGVKLDFGLPEPIGTVLALRFRLPGTEHEFNVKAEIVATGWQQDHPTTSLRFLEMTVDEYVIITRFVSDTSQSDQPTAANPPA